MFVPCYIFCITSKMPVMSGTNIRFRTFIYFGRAAGNLSFRAFKNNQHIFLFISTMAQFRDTRIFFVTETLNRRIDFVKKDKSRLLKP